MAPVPFPRSIGGYELEEEIGRGSYGVVFRVHRAQAHFYRAMKLMPLPDQDAAAAWREEIRRLEQLDHPNIVKFHDADIAVLGSDGARSAHAWIATELCERSLLDELARRPEGTLPPGQVAQLLTAMLSALAAADKQKMVHRDVKPGNILLTSRGTWKLCDFGTARLLPTGASHLDTQVIGTLPYMSRAALNGEQDHAADLYALGVTIHEALCGERLHRRGPGMDDAAYVRLVMSSDPVVSPRLDRRWREVIEKLTSPQARLGGAASTGDERMRAGDLLSWFRREGRPRHWREPAGGTGSAPAGVGDRDDETEVTELRHDPTRGFTRPVEKPPRPPVVRPWLLDRWRAGAARFRSWRSARRDRAPGAPWNGWGPVRSLVLSSRSSTRAFDVAALAVVAAGAVEWLVGRPVGGVLAGWADPSSVGRLTIGASVDAPGNAVALGAGALLAAVLALVRLDAMARAAAAVAAAGGAWSAYLVLTPMSGLRALPHLSMLVLAVLGLHALAALAALLAALRPLR